MSVMQISLESPLQNTPMCSLCMRLHGHFAFLLRLASTQSYVWHVYNTDFTNTDTEFSVLL